MAFGLFLAIGLALMAGFPVAFTLAGTGLLFAGLGVLTGTFDAVFLEAFPNRIYGIMTNETLIAVPIFVFMGVMLERSKLADQLLQSLAQIMRGVPGGLGTDFSSDHACQGLPPVCRHRHHLLCRHAGADYSAIHRVGNAGGRSVECIPAGLKPETMPADEDSGEDRVSLGRLLALTAGPLMLIVAVLGSILKGIATPTEAAAVGAVGAILLASISGNLSMETMKDVVYRTSSISAMVFMILIGASLFSLVFRGFGGDELIAELLTGLPGGVVTAMITVMLVMFLLGFVLDFIEITFVVVPIVGPVLMAMGLNPIWLGIMMALNLQTSFLTPPFGFSLFYLRGVCPDSVPTSAIYRGVIPFIIIQVLVLGLLALIPELVTWLPGVIYPG